MRIKTHKRRTTRQLVSRWGMSFVALTFVVTGIITAVGNLRAQASENAWNPVNIAIDTPAIGQWNDIAASADGQKVVTMSSVTTDGYGFIYVSSDAGETWSAQLDDAQRRWKSVAISGDGTKLAAVAYTDHLYTSNNGGETWTAHTELGAQAWTSVAISSDGTKAVATAQGLYSDYSMYTSNDSGATWQGLASTGIREWSDVVINNDGTQIMATQYRTVWVSNDAGQTWEETLTEVVRDYKSWRGLSMSDDGTVRVALDYDGYVYVSNDSGQTWVAQEDLGARRWSASAISADGTHIALTLHGEYNGSMRIDLDSVPTALVTSNDSGATWNIKPAAGMRHWTGITISSNGNILTGSTYQDSIYSSLDAGSTWVARAEGLPVRGNMIWLSPSVDDEGKVLAIIEGESGTLFISSDYGATWQVRENSNASKWGWVAVNSTGSKIYGVTQDGGLFISSDNGGSWEQVSTGPVVPEFYRIIEASGSTTLVASAINGSVYSSTDEGQTWSQIFDSQTAEPVPLSVAASADGKTLIINAIGGSLLTSLDSGATWVQQIADTPHQWFAADVSADGSTFLAASVTGGLYSSTDSGATWVQHLNEAPRMWSGAQVSNDGQTFIATAYGDAVYISTDAGQTWQAQVATASKDWYSVASSGDGSTILAGAVGEKPYLRQTSRTQTPPSQPTPPQLDNNAMASTDRNNPQPISNKRPTFTGKAAPLSTVVVTVNSDPIICTTTADAQGNWSCTLPSDVPAGVHTVTVAVTDPDTNTTQTFGPFYIEAGETVTDGTPIVQIPGVPNTGAQRVQQSAPVLLSALIGAAAALLIGLPFLKRRSTR